MCKFMSKDVDHNWAGQTEERNQPENSAQGEEPKLFACPKPLRDGRARKNREKCLTQNCADRQQKNRKDKLYPTCGHRERIGLGNESSRPRDTSDHLSVALRFSPAAAVRRSSLRCSQSCRRLRRFTRIWERQFNSQRRDYTDRADELYAQALRVRALASRPAHVGAGAGVDLDCFAFFDEQRDVDRLAGLQSCRLGHVARSIASQAFGRLHHLEANGGG